MRFVRYLGNLGSLILIVGVPLCAWTGFYNAVEAPKLTLALWSVVAIFWAWSVGALAGYCRPYPSSPLTWVGCAFFLLLAASGLWQGMPFHAREDALLYLSGGALLWAWDSLWSSPLFWAWNGARGGETAQEETEAPADWERRRLNYGWTLIGYLSLACLLASLYAYLQRLTPWNLSLLGIPLADPLQWNDDKLVYVRTISTFGNPIFFGAWAATVLPLAFVWLQTRSWSKGRLFVAYGAWLISLTALFFTLGRATWLGITAGLAITILFLFWPHAKKRLVLYLLLLGLVVTFNVALCFANVQHPSLDTHERLSSMSSARDSSISARLFFWQAAWRNAWAWPLTGVGPGGQEGAAYLHRELEPLATRAQGRTPDSAHNQFLDILACAGWPGFLLLLATLVLFALSLRQIQNIEMRAALLGAAVSFWTAHLFTSGTVSAEFLWIFIVALASLYSRPAPDPIPSPDTGSLGELPARAQLAIGVGFIIFLSATLAAALSFSSLRWGELGLEASNRADADFAAQPPRSLEGELQSYRALALFQKAANFSPAWMGWHYHQRMSNSYLSLFKYGRPEQRPRNWLQAKENCQIAIALAPHKPFLYELLATIYMLQPQSAPMAPHAVNMAIALDPRNPRYLLFKARILTDLGRYEQALKVLDHVDGIVPSLSHSLYNRFAIYTFQGRQAEAQKIYNYLSPRDPQAQRAMDGLRQQYASKESSPR